MTLGALAFLSPWLLTALATLPVIYWLLKTVPPRPKQVAFPATRILVGLESEEKTPASTPWWLLLIRLLAAALVIFALAEPVLNPTQSKALQGTGPVVIVVDNGWAAADGWSRRLALGERFINEAQSQSRPVLIVETAPASRARTLHIEAPSEARSTLAALEPRPYAPDRKGALAALQATLGTNPKGDPSIVWLTDGIDHDTGARAFADGLAAASRSGTFSVVSDTAGEETLGLVAGVGAAGKLTATVIRTGGPERQGIIHAFSARGQRLGEAPFHFAPNEKSQEVTFDLPLELRNQVARLEIPGEHSAGAVSLLDGRSQWQRVGLLSGESQEESQPLLAPLYYVEKAIQPFAEIVRSKDHNLAVGIDDALKQRASVLMLADIGTLTGDVKDHVEAWVKRGGVLVRFAGPRLENGGDGLLPVALRTGGRTLGGALSWSNPQPLAPFDDTSLFAGLTVPSDVAVNRQVLADPAELGPNVKIWARLQDGTPLVTASTLGAGQIILFHITANSDWSNLPISGLFVEMLHRITSLGTLTSAAGGDEASVKSATTDDRARTADAFPPVQTLDGFGMLRPPPPTAEAIPAAKLASVTASLIHPPGYYGAAASPRAINIVTPKTELAPLPALPRGSEQLGYESEAPTPLMPWLLAAALALILADMIAVLAMLGGSLIGGLWKPRPGAAAMLLVATAFGALLDLAPSPAFAQDHAPSAARPPALSQRVTDAIAQEATENVTLGYVLTGDAATDQTSKAGLSGLSRVLAVRTAVEPGNPIAVDIVNDEISFFPVLYWPVIESAKPLPEPTLAKIDAYMKQGGLIIFDTRDANTGLPSGTRLQGRNTSALQRLIGSLDMPRLEPVPEDHVLTKSFYLLRAFPGRFDNGALWVEASDGSDSEGRKARRADGVTSIMVTSNDFASAWALDASGRPLYPVVPGGETQREMALRTGVNIVMHALTGNYKADQVHVPALLERLGQ